MSLPIYNPPTRVIELPKGNGSFVVAGLSFEDITALVNDFLPDITLAVEKYRDSMKDTYTRANMDAFLAVLLNSFPELAAQVIARAAGGGVGEAEVARRYPVGVQLRAMATIAELTMEDMGDLSDPSPALAALIRQATGAIQSTLKLQSLSTSGPAVAPPPTS